MLNGELDIAGTDTLDQEIAEIAAAGPADVVLDLSALDFVDSTGLKSFLKAHDMSLARGFRLWIVPGDGAVARVLRLTGLDGVLPLVKSVPNLDEAAAPAYPEVIAP
jgi:anti-sigma B factor antagonist